MTQVSAALEGWHTMDADSPALIGTQCNHCNTYYFPKQSRFCRNPDCDSNEFSEVELSKTGKIWSYTNAGYKPPEPFVAPDPFVPFTLAAVELEKEQMIVMGQVIAGVDVSDLKVGMEVELVLDTLYKNDEEEKLTWKWRPLGQTTTGDNA